LGVLYVMLTSDNYVQCPVCGQSPCECGGNQGFIEESQKESQLRVRCAVLESQVSVLEKQLKYFTTPPGFHL
jgi:hypothetical protein